jgi:hypothetical protein
MLLTTHAMDEAEALADQVFIVDQGRVTISGTVASADQVRRESRDRLPYPHQCTSQNMTALDLSPAPKAAPPAKRILRHGLIEARLLIRNSEQLLLALVIPMAILVAGRFVNSRSRSLELLGPSVLALAVWSSAIYTQQRSAPPSSAVTVCSSGWRPHHWASPAC